MGTETAQFLQGIRRLRAERGDAEPLTLAYVAIGAADYWRGQPEAARGYMADRYDGQLGFIEAVIAHAAMLDQMAISESIDHELSGVFTYDIAEEFGRRFARALFDEEDVLHSTPRALAEGIARQLFKEDAQA